jgi:hypothetical protein
MNGFDKARLVEARSMLLLQPFLDDLNGKYVLTNKGRLAKHLQETFGDLLFNDRRGRIWAVEHKAEEHYTQNLFLETWSNRNLESWESRAARGSNPGWMYKTRADLLFYHFLDADALFIVNMFALARWAFRTPSKRRGERANRIGAEYMVGRIWDFPEREQKQHQQLNDTHGRIVPIQVLQQEMEVPPRRFSVSQLRLDLFGEAA